MLFGADISEWNGQLNWDAFNASSNFVIIRSCFGTARQDLEFGRNRAEARRVQAQAGPLGIGYYHYAYPQYNNPEAEADFFISNVWPLQQGELLALDWEEAYDGDHVAWCLAFLKRCELKTGVKPLLYLNQSLMNGHNWMPVIENGNGLWLADYRGTQSSPAVNTPWAVMAVRQWTNVDVIPGIGGHVDGDTFYGDITAWNAYGYHVPVASPDPEPTPEPAPTTVPDPEPLPPVIETPVSEPATPPIVDPPVEPPVSEATGAATESEVLPTPSTQAPYSDAPAPSLWRRFINWIIWLVVG